MNRFAYILAAILMFALPASRGAAQLPADGFAVGVDLAPLGRLAVHTEGRVKSFESFARSMMQFVSGPRRIDGQAAAFTYLDLMLRPQRYENAALIYVKKKPMRAQIAQALRRSLDENLGDHAQAGPMTAQFDAELAHFMKTGLVSPILIRDPHVLALLERLRADLLRTARFVDEIETAMSVKDPFVLRQNLRLVAPPGGGFDSSWLTLDDLAQAAHLDGAPALPIDETLQSQLTAQWMAFTEAWQQADAVKVNMAAAQLATLLPAVNPAVYPSQSRLGWERWYFNARNMTWVWLVYAAASVPLLLFVVFRWSGARWLGMAIFFIAFALHTGAVMLRWYVADRWPNSNMFEAITTAAWFGGCFAVVIEHFVRHRSVRGLFALASATASMAALMAVHFLPLQLNPQIGNMMPVLHDVWLYIHTNVIIFSYCLIFLAAVSAGLYLLYRLMGMIRGIDRSRDYARVGGAASLIMTTPDGQRYLEQSKTTLGHVLDGTTMILMELSFVLLWTGLVMGAIWADHSWGRPWGWDPKEVFALNTFLVFAVLVHTRLKVRDKGLWTAVLAVIGCAVMLFNWVVINFAISGLHSYA